MSTSTPRALARLTPYVRGVMPALLGSAVAAGAATLLSLMFPLVISWIIDGPLTNRSLEQLWWPGIVLLVIGFAEAGLWWLRRVLVARPVMRAEAQLRTALYDKLQALPLSFHARFPAGQLLSRAVSDLSTIRRFLAFGLVFLLVNVATFIIGVILLISLSVTLGLVVAALALPLIVLCLVYEVKYQVLARLSQDQVGDLTTRVEESVLGIRILKSFGRSGHVARIFRDEAIALAGTEKRKAKAVAALWSSVIALPEIALGIALFLGVHQVADGAMSTGALVAFFGIAMGLRWPIDSIGWLLAMANEAGTAAIRFYEVMDEPVPITSPTDPVPSPPRLGLLEFRDVRFTFPDGTDELLRGVDLRVEPGETVALVGATGSGKSTLLELVSRLKDVTGGAVLVDGVDVRTLALDDLRGRIHPAFEDPTLFSASVRENVLVGDPDADDPATEQALRLARAEFVHELPFGLDTRIGEQGMSLSGGQRQRLALARSAIGHPEIMVLDDPLSALDIHTEEEVERSLQSALHHTTALIVAHRASTVLLADRVALLAHGRIAATGTHSELLRTVPAYRELLSSLESGDVLTGQEVPSR